MSGIIGKDPFNKSGIIGKDFHRPTSTTGNSTWSTEFKMVFDDGFMIQKAYLSTGNSTGNKSISWPTAFSTVYGAIPYVLDNGDRHGYVDTNGGPSTTGISCHYTMTGGSAGTSYIFFYVWGYV